MDGVRRCSGQCCKSGSSSTSVAVLVLVSVTLCASAKQPGLYIHGLFKRVRRISCAYEHGRRHAEEILGLLVATVVLCSVVYRCTAKTVLLHVHTWKCSVVKVRGNAGERSSWAQTLLASVNPRPHTAVNSTSRSRGPLRLTVGLQFFQSSRAPKFIL